MAGEGLGVAALGAGVFFLCVVAAGLGEVVEELGFGGGGSSLFPEEEGDSVGEHLLEGGLGVEFLVEGGGEGGEVFAFVVGDEGFGGEAGS